MYQFPEALLFVNSSKAVLAGTLTVGHHTIVGSDYARKEAKAQDTLTVVVFEAFIIDEGDLFFQNGPEHALVVGLLFLGVGKEEISLVCQQIFFRNFFYSEKYITVGKVLFDLYAGGNVFLVCVTAIRRGLGDDSYVRGVLLDPFALCRCQGNPIVGGYLSFA